MGVADVITSHMDMGADLEGLMWTWDGDEETLIDEDGFLGCFDCDVRLFMGCSKAVVAADFLPAFVMKFPVLGHMDQKGERSRFTGARCGSAFDYCHMEEEVYRKAADEGLSDMFCATRHVLDTSGGYPVYVSERADGSLSREIYRYHTSAEAVRYADSKYGTTSIPDKTLALFYDSWGEDATNRLCRFLSHNELSDFHFGNVGFMDGKIRLIDYSDFNY